MNDREGDELKIGDFVETISPKDFGVDGKRKEGIVVDLTPDSVLTDQVGVVFGARNYLLLRSVSPKYVTKKLHSETKMKALEEAHKLYLEMQETAVTA